MYGWRARLAVMVPSGMVVTEPDFSLMAPEGVSCHYHRIPFQGGGIKDLKAAENSVAEATRILLHARPSVMAMAGTGTSFAGGYGYDQQIIKKMKEINGDLPTTTTTTSVVDALKRLNIKKVSIAMPYLEEVSRTAAKFVEDSGIRVMNMKWLGKTAGMCDVPKEVVYRLAKEVDHPESEAVFISCIDLHTLDIIEKLEGDLGKPVVSSNQATMWNMLRLAGVKDKLTGFGTLFSQ